MSERYQRHKHAIAKYYREHREQISVYKSKWQRRARIKLIRKLGEKCFSCGSRTRIHLTRKNTLICDGCIKSKMVSKQPDYQIKKRLKRMARLSRTQIEAEKELCRIRCAKYRRLHPDRRAALKIKRRLAKLDVKNQFSFEDWNVMVRFCNSVCLACKKKTKMTQDHIKPLTRGGLHAVSNIQPLCHPCNSRKGTRRTDYRKSGWLRSFTTFLKEYTGAKNLLR